MNSPMPAISLRGQHADQDHLDQLADQPEAERLADAVDDPGGVFMGARREQPDQTVAVVVRLRREIDAADDHDDERFKESRADFQETRENARHRNVRAAEVIEQEFAVWRTLEAAMDVLRSG
jgi:hypothetical protein